MNSGPGAILFPVTPPCRKNTRGARSRAEREEEVHGAWTTGEPARHGHRAAEAGKQTLAQGRTALKEPAREVPGDEAP
ncbi:hypothetical protein GCM10010398_15880 [Streptomyces fimbriatus]